jgi:hypothetical protein
MDKKHLLLIELFQRASDYKLALYNEEFAEMNGGVEKFKIRLMQTTLEVEMWYENM